MKWKHYTDYEQNEHLFLFFPKKVWFCCENEFFWVWLEWVWKWNGMYYYDRPTIDDRIEFYRKKKTK